MAHVLVYYTHGLTRTFSPTISNPSNNSNPPPPPTPSNYPQATTPRVFGAYGARYTHSYLSRCRMHVGTLSPTSQYPVTPMRATLSSILLAQRSALERIESLRATNRDPDAEYLPIDEDPKFRAELNEGVGFYLDIYSSSEEVISLIHKWPFNDAAKGIIPSEHLPYLDLIMQFDELHVKLRKLGQASLGYRVKYHYIPASKNQEVEVQVMAELDEYAARLEKNLEEKERETVRCEVEQPLILKTMPISKPGGTSIPTPKSTKMNRNSKEKGKGIARGDEMEIDEEVEELSILKTMPISKPGGTSIQTPKSTSGGKSFLTPQLTPIQKPKPKPKLKLISRDPRVRQNFTPKPPEL